jgi:hypothetical protein
MKSKKLFQFKHFEIIKKEIGVLQSNCEHLPFFTHGRWSMHETLLYLLSETGPATVSISSFSLSDITVQVFARAIQEKYITRLDLLLNNAVKRNKLDILLFAKNVVNRIGMAHTHMKLMLIENSSWKVVVNQSANSTINPAWETGVISTSELVFEKYRTYLDKAFGESVTIWN